MVLEWRCDDLELGSHQAGSNAFRECLLECGGDATFPIVSDPKLPGPDAISLTEALNPPFNVRGTIATRALIGVARAGCID